MANIGKLQAALASATNEVTLAAANFNFDFSLFKCEAPKEFSMLGSALSKHRKDNAEYGSIHITARRLGALFDGLSPSTPHLLKAYGTRVSEIAQEAKQANEPEIESSIFAAHSGVDGTSIWAAATSSPAALHVQLLACMLSRLWQASEAVSVWFELVKERRREIGLKYEANESLPYAAFMSAAQADISRASLAEWDASARSWLRTADRVKIGQQDQLTSLLAKINIPINNDMGVYKSVVAAWNSALDSMESLVTGMPQAANNDGPCLLALSSWHIYPDILTVSEPSVLHRFQDPLVQEGGTLTLGLNHPGGSGSRGVFWSLSLAHLNYYGRPVSREARLDIQSRRVTFDQFTQAAFGAFLGHWDLLGPAADYPARFFVCTRSALQRAADSPASDTTTKETCLGLLRDQSNGLNMLIKAATRFIESRNFKEDLIHKLVAFGSKRADQFIPSTSYRTFMGLDDSRLIISMLRGPEERIRFLRHVASGCELPQGYLIIRYTQTDRSLGVRNLCGFASTHPHATGSRTPGGQGTLSHSRWIPKSLVGNTACENEMVMEMPEEISLSYTNFCSSFEMPTSSSVSEPNIQTFDYVFGDRENAAIFIDHGSLQRDLRKGASSSLPRSATIEDLIWCLESDMFAMDRFVNYFKGSTFTLSPQGRTLRSLSVAHKVYQSLPNATLSTRILNSALYSTKWSHEALKDPVLPEGRPIYDHISLGHLCEPFIDQGVALSCAAYMEGAFDIEPASLARVFAIAYEDSIYVSMQLTCDPWVVPNPYELRRIAGNIGKPGLTMLIPPKEPIVSSQEDSSWRVVSDKEFDGSPENHFSKSSMHLSFTEYYLPFVQHNHAQGQDNQIYLLESVVSVYHCGEWIGDVDVQACLNSSLLARIPEIYCHTKHDGEPASLDGALSVESWVDIIDPPNRTNIIRAYGSFLARLAAVVIYIQTRSNHNKGALSNSICVVPEKFCWVCYGRSWLSSEGHAPGTIRVPGLGRTMLY